MAMTGMDAWWNLDCSLVAFTLAVNLPIALRQMKGDYYGVASKMLLALGEDVHKLKALK